MSIYAPPGSHVYLHIRGLVTLTCPLFVAFWKLSACHGQPFSKYVYTHDEEGLSDLEPVVKFASP